MQGLVEAVPVLYVMTFSKTLFPALRLGFLVLPRVLLTATQAPLEQMLRGDICMSSWLWPTLLRAVSSAVIFGRMRHLHKIVGGHAGLDDALADIRARSSTRRYGIMPLTLSDFAPRSHPEDNGLVLGYGNTSAYLFGQLVQRLARLAHAVFCR